jgi:hypothetical protein
MSISGDGSQIAFGVQDTSDQYAIGQYDYGAVHTYFTDITDYVYGYVKGLYGKDDGNGAGYVWSNVLRKSAPTLTGTSAEEFGFNVKLSVDATTLMAATAWTYKVRIYTRSVPGNSGSTAGWQLTQTFDNGAWNTFRTLSMTMSANGMRFVVSDKSTTNSTVAVYNVGGGLVFRKISPTNTTNFGNNVELSGDGMVLATTEVVGNFTRVYLWNVDTGQRIGSDGDIQMTTYGNISWQNLSLSVDGSNLVFSNGSLGSNNQALVYDILPTRHLNYTVSSYPGASQPGRSATKSFVTLSGSNAGSIPYQATTAGQNGSSTTISKSLQLI